MQIAGQTVLITGGGTGIGLALAKRFMAHGSRVVAAGRRVDTLLAAQRSTPGLEVLPGDVSSEAGRIALVEEALLRFPALNVLVNNAGIGQRHPSFLEAQDWASHRAELATNLDAPMHLSMLLLPHFATRPSAAVVNVTSGLAFTPFAALPTYSLTKAALHSLTISLRLQVRNTAIDVVEIVPPSVRTDFTGGAAGVDLDAFADATFARLAAGETEIGFGTAETRRLASRQELDAYIAELNRAEA